MTDETATDMEFDKLRDDVSAEISLATGWDDSDDYAVDVKGAITDAVMRLVGQPLLAAEAKQRADRVAELEQENERLRRTVAEYENCITWLGPLAGAALEDRP